MRTVEQQQDARELGLPPSVREALGELANAAKDGLLALSVGVGLGVLTELMEKEVDGVVGPKGQRDPDRVAVRHGHEAGAVTLGGRRVGVARPPASRRRGRGAACDLSRLRPTKSRETADLAKLAIAVEAGLNSHRPTHNPTETTNLLIQA
jgi:hypothetical protein